MPVSVNSKDRGIQDMVLANGRRVRVFLDGIEINEVITADSKLGIVERYKSDAAGKPVISGDEAARETLTGEVRIEII